MPSIFYHSLACLYTQSSYGNSKTLHIKITHSIRELIFSTATYKKNNFTHFPVHKHHKNHQKSPQKFKTTRTRSLINQRSYLNTPFGGHVLINWLTEYLFMVRCWETSLVEKSENGETKNGDARRAKIVFAIR